MLPHSFALTAAAAAVAVVVTPKRKIAGLLADQVRSNLTGQVG